MVDIVQALQTSFDIAKRLRDLNSKVSEADFKMLLADLLSELSDARVEAASLKDKIAGLMDENRELRQKAEARSEPNPELHEGAYVFGDPARHYCTACYDTKGVKVLVKEMDGHFRDFGQWMCPACNASMGASRF